MKRFVMYIFILFCSISCSNFSSKTENTTATEETIHATDTSVETTATTEEIVIPTIERLMETLQPDVTNKLQANYEALLLLNKHPEFTEAIVEQLQASSKFEQALSDTIENIQVRELQYIDDLKVINDSMSIQKIRFTLLVNSSYTQKDSANVYVKRRIVKLDETLKMQTDISFQTIKK